MTLDSCNTLKHIALDALSERLRAIERGGLDSGRSTGQAFATGWAAVDAALGGAAAAGAAGGDVVRPMAAGLALGAVHEWCGLARPEGEPAPLWSPPLCVLMHLVRRTLQQRPGQAVWIGRAIWPYPLALASCSDGLLERCIFVDVGSAAAAKPIRQPRSDARLWAADLALRSGAVSVVVLDASGLSMAGTRRLQLAAEAGQSLGLLLRPPQEAQTLTAALTRWRVQAEPSPLDRPRFALTLLRAKAGVLRSARAEHELSFLLEWSRATTDVVCLPADLAGGPGATAAPQGDDVGRHRSQRQAG